MFFFFKQKTAYEMRISDWSSDVCSSDLARGQRHRGQPQQADDGGEHQDADRADRQQHEERDGDGAQEVEQRQQVLLAVAAAQQAGAARPSGSATEMSSTSCSPSFTTSPFTASTSTLTYLRITSSSPRCSRGR